MKRLVKNRCSGGVDPDDDYAMRMHTTHLHVESELRATERRTDIVIIS